MSNDDSDWRKRLGIDFHIELSDSDLDEESHSRSEVTTVVKDGKDQRHRKSGSGSDVAEEETETLESFDSFSQEEEELAKYYLKEFGRTPPRTQRLRRQKERDAYCSQAKAAAKTIKATLKRRDTAERFLSLPGFSECGIPEASPERTRQVYREQKRTKDRQRSQDREWKMSEVDTAAANRMNFLSATDNDERCESLPPLSPAIKVDSKSRYMSVSCRKLEEEENVDTTDGVCRKISVMELPQDRMKYFAELQTCLRTGSQEVTLHQRQRSEQEVLYQQELYEMLWLELQAWHAGMDTSSFDTHLIAKRHEVLDILHEVLYFRFDPSHSDKPQEEMDISDSRITTVDDLVTTGDIQIGGVPIKSSYAVDGAGSNRLVGEEECNNCLSIWCKTCQDKQTEGLAQVARLLKRLDYVESLFPSTKKLAFHFPEWEDPEFSGRYKALCVWYNATVQLRMKIEVVGKLLGNMTPAMIPWPTFNTVYPGMSTPSSSYDSGMPLLTTYEEPQTVESEVQPSRNVSAVRFVIDCDKSDASSNPSDSNNSTDSGHTTASTNSGLLVPPGQSSVPPPGGLRRCLSDLFVEANPYRKYVEKLLRNKGMKKTFDKIAEVIKDVMSRTTCILEETHQKSSNEYMKKIVDDNHHSSAFQDNLQELIQYGPWTPKFEAMELPSFHALFIFLASVSLQMMRECLKLRLEQMPDKPSRLSIKELMREYKEGVKFAVVVRQKYLRACQALFINLSPKLRENLEIRQNQAIEELDSNIKRMLEVYLEWLDQFVCMLHREPHASGLQRNFLQEEWRFVQATCPHVTEGDSLAATRFCNIACHMLCSVGDFIDTGIDDQMAALQDSTLENLDDTPEDEEEMDLDDIQKKRLLQRCRALQVLLGETRERSLRAAGLAKMLRKDLELAAEFCLADEPSVVMSRLRETGHIRVLAPHSQNHLIFVPGRIKKKTAYIWHLLDMRVGGVGLEHETHVEGGYLVLMRCDDCDNLCKLWMGDVIKIEPTADSTITLSRVLVTGLLLVVSTGTMLVPVRREFLECMGSTVGLVRDQTAPNKTVTHSIDELKTEALELCERVQKNIKQVESMTDLEHVIPDVEDAERRQLHLVTRDVVHQYYMFGFEYHKEVTRLVTGLHRANVAPFLVTLARLWMKFVVAHYSQGKGQRPRWANAGLEFIVFVCDPHNTRYLQDEDFLKLKEEIESCRRYIIGTAPAPSQPTTPLTPVLPRHFRSASTSSMGHVPPERSLSTQSSQGDYSPNVNPTDSPLLRRHITRHSHPTFEKSADHTDSSGLHSAAKPIERIRKKITEMESEIEMCLREEKMIGRVSDTQRDKIHFKPRSVSFSWQRGFKIGAGRFGKVYTAVNNNTGDLMAMKVLPLQPNDHRSIRRVADELRIFEGITHPHLVQCYGVEIHNDEMLMFMEYCDEGTLESLSISTETGLPEEIVRKYTRQLLEAVNTLHDRGIVHRDIKGANIFLTEEGNTLKLGDFGCAVRLRGHQTEIGELAGIVGTHAYMAPEIFQSSEGHGRAADVWSVGCVVIEMATGKRPWPEYDSSVQIMFRVGMGQSPTIPKHLSEEGHEFLAGCFIHDPKKRSTVAQLLDHTFVKVDTGEDCTSLPLFSHPPVVPYMKLLANT